jgi:6-pyruvoyltetrahydropterin/6-carboxytetrahydropterin synthase
MEISKSFHFSAAHMLPNVPKGHKCGRLHGHTFHVEVQLSGAVDPELGWIQDFGDLKRAFEPVEEQLDHRYLNEIEGLENPTSENIARWIWQRLHPALPSLRRVIVRESASSCAIYQGEEE